MTLDDKVRLLNSIFPKSEKDEELGKSYGVYLQKLPEGLWTIFINALFFAGWRDLENDIFDAGVGQNIPSLKQVLKLIKGERMSIGPLKSGTGKP
jgi:hypothetical protein